MSVREASPKKMRHTEGWSRPTQKWLDLAKPVIEDLCEYWPLTLRQVFYQLVARVLIENTKHNYNKLSRVLVKARLQGIVPWEAMEDRSRSHLASGGWLGVDWFVADEVDDFLHGYRRDLLQSQSVALECWIEKDALSHVAHRVALPYCVPVVVARGFSSVDYIHRCAERAERNRRDGRDTRLLWFTDLDPSGMDMMPGVMNCLHNELGVTSIEGVRYALTPEQVEQHGLAHAPTALKWTDTRADKHVARYGELAVELDALHPATLQDAVKGAIEQNLDMAQFSVEQEREPEDIERIRGIAVSRHVAPRRRGRDVIMSLEAAQAYHHRGIFPVKVPATRSRSQSQRSVSRMIRPNDETLARFEQVGGRQPYRGRRENHKQDANHDRSGTTSLGRADPRPEAARRPDAGQGRVGRAADRAG